jgi:hypothetical protein
MTEFEPWLTTTFAMTKAPTHFEIMASILDTLAGAEGFNSDTMTTKGRKWAGSHWPAEPGKPWGRAIKAGHLKKVRRSERYCLADPDSKYASDPAVQAIVRYFEGQE